MLSKNIETFLGCDKDYADSNIVIFGAPLDATASYRPGARFASRVMRAESYALETYSPYQDLDIEDAAVFDGGDIELGFGNVNSALERIEGFVARLLEDGKLPVMVGGEHLVSLGAVRAAKKRYENLNIIHFDAHADLREDYLGERLSHATVMRRIWEIVGDGRIYQFGIRSGERAEFLWGESHVKMQKFNFNGLEKVVGELYGKPVYLTIDLDVLDPAEFPGTGTPEAGGVSFTKLLAAILEVARLNIVGCDINELSPGHDPSGASTLLACKVLRELVLALGKK